MGGGGASLVLPLSQLDPEEVITGLFTGIIQRYHVYADPFPHESLWDPSC